MAALTRSTRRRDVIYESDNETVLALPLRRRDGVVAGIGSSGSAGVDRCQLSEPCSSGIASVFELPVAGTSVALGLFAFCSLREAINPVSSVSNTVSGGDGISGAAVATVSSIVDGGSGDTGIGDQATGDAGGLGSDPSHQGQGPKNLFKGPSRSLSKNQEYFFGLRSSAIERT